jgi:hypothetical protein
MRATLAALLGLLVFPTDSRALCVGPNPPCQRFWAADAVFIGTVTGITCRVTEPDPMGPPADEVHLRVVEAFRGVTGPEVTLRNWECGNVRLSVGVDFQVGQTYFVYAGRNEETGMLGTSSCVTTEIDQAAESVAYARSLKGPATRGRVFGQVVHHREDIQTGEYLLEPLPQDLAVVLSGPGGLRRVSPDANGRFEFEVLPGTYEVTATAKGPYALPEAITVEIPAPHACSEVPLAIRYRASVRGRVLDSHGRPVKELTVTFAPATPSGSERTLEWSTSTDESGEFLAASLSPGRYVLGVNIVYPPNERAPYAPTYVPGEHDVASARVLEIAPGTEIDVGDLLLPPALHAVTISGRVVLPEGYTGQGLMVSPIDPRSRLDIVIDPPSIRPDGTFTVTLYQGQRYVVSAYHEPSGFSGESAPFVAGQTSPILVELKPPRKRRPR